MILCLKACFLWAYWQQRRLASSCFYLVNDVENELCWVNCYSNQAIFASISSKALFVFHILISSLVLYLLAVYIFLLFLSTSPSYRWSRCQKNTRSDDGCSTSSWDHQQQTLYYQTIWRGAYGVGGPILTFFLILSFSFGSFGRAFIHIFVVQLIGSLPLLLLLFRFSFLFFFLKTDPF